MQNITTSNQVDVSFHPEAFEEALWEYYASLRVHGEVFWAAAQRSFIVQSHTLAEAVLRSRDFRSDHPFRRSRLAFGQTLSDTDGPQHRMQRQFVTAELGGRALRGVIEDTVVPAVDELVQACVGREVVDIHQEYAVPLPWRVACRLVGVEESAVDFLEPSVVTLTRFLDDTRLSVEQLLKDREIIEGNTRERLQDATTGLLGRAREALASGTWDEETLVRATTLMLSATTQSTVGAIGIMMHTLVTQSRWQAALRAGRVSVADFVREVLRWEPPLHLVLRFANGRMQLGGQNVPSGSAIQVNLAAANRDPDVFLLPDIFDPTRQSRDDLSFGRGVHTCPGSRMATAELELTLQGFLDATDWIEAESVQPIAGRNFRVAKGLIIRCHERKS